MAVESKDRINKKGKVAAINCKKNSDSNYDEIALRDEILQLKRQVMFLKKTNEHNMIKFRKYEDEAKRKDRQIEQLMDPRKNADITKILSTKGAAILMNLKDQNNSLIQMILSKDMQIRRLTAEIKMSKLYSGSKKNESHGAELVRLRNLLTKSHKIFNDSIESGQQQHQQNQTIFLYNDDSLYDISHCSNNEISPRELEELRFTIRGLEEHLRYSNDLLLKKNQEIMTLTAELNALKLPNQCRACRNVPKSQIAAYEHRSMQRITRSQEIPTSWKETEKSTSPYLGSVKVTDDEKFLQPLAKLYAEKLPNSAPSSFLRLSPTENFTPKNESAVGLRDVSEINVSEKTRNEYFINHGECGSQKENSIQNNSKSDSSTNTNSNFSAIKVETGEKISERKKCSNQKIKGKWKKALIKFKQHKKQNPKGKDMKNPSKSRQRERGKKICEENLEKEIERSEMSDLETHEFEIMEKELGSDGGEEKKFKNTEFQESKYSRKISEIPSEDKLEKNENYVGGRGSSSRDDNFLRSMNFEYEKKAETIVNKKQTVHFEKNFLDIKSDIDHSAKNVERSDAPDCLDETKRNSFPLHKVFISKKCDEISESLNHLEKYGSETYRIKEEISNLVATSSPEIQKELQDLYENITTFEELETKQRKSNPDAHRQSFDSSFDSENGYPTREAQIVQVEVEINMSNQNIFENLQEPSPGQFLARKRTKNCENDDNIQEKEEDDDDDVIIQSRAIQYFQ